MDTGDATPPPPEITDPSPGVSTWLSGGPNKMLLPYMSVNMCMCVHVCVLRLQIRQKQFINEVPKKMSPREPKINRKKALADEANIQHHFCPKILDNFFKKNVLCFRNFNIIKSRDKEACWGSDRQKPITYGKGLQLAFCQVPANGNSFLVNRAVGTFEYDSSSGSIRHNSRRFSRLNFKHRLL